MASLSSMKCLNLLSKFTANVMPHTVIILHTASSCSTQRLLCWWTKSGQACRQVLGRHTETDTHTHTHKSLAAPAVKVSVFSRQNRGLNKPWENVEECTLMCAIGLLWISPVHSEIFSKLLHLWCIIKGQTQTNISDHHRSWISTLPGKDIYNMDR